MKHLTLLIALLVRTVTASNCPHELNERFFGGAVTIEEKKKCVTWIDQPRKTKTGTPDYCNLFFQGTMVSMKFYDKMKEFYRKTEYDNRNLTGKRFQLSGRAVKAGKGQIEIEFEDHTRSNVEMEVPEEVMKGTSDGHFPKPLCILSEVGTDIPLLRDCNDTQTEGQFCLSDPIEKIAPGQKCTAERQGSLCLFNHDPCRAPNPCRHNMVCKNTGNGNFECNCTSDRYSGDKCKQETTLCASQNCTGGTCLEVTENKTKKAVCRCQHGKTGDNCDKAVDFCKNVFCYFEGTCQSGESDFTCNCPAGHAGKKCEIGGQSQAGVSKVVIAAAAGGASFVLLFACCGLFLLQHKRKKKRRGATMASLAVRKNADSIISSVLFHGFLRDPTGESREEEPMKF